MKKEHRVSSYLYILLIFAVLFSVVNIVLLKSRNVDLKKDQELLKEQQRPANIDIIKIVISNCEECYDIEQAVTQLKTQNVDIKKEETLQSTSEQAQQIIQQYEIKKLPTLLITGEINKSEQIQGFFQSKGEVKDGAVIFTSITPPYYDLSKNKIIGKVTVTHIVDSACKECSSLSQLSAALEQAGVFIAQEKSVEYESEEGTDLIQTFGVQRIPALLLSQDIDAYEDLKEEIQQLNLEEKNGFYALHSLVPPYRDLEEKRIVGLVDMILVTDNSCSNCYDVSINKPVVQRFGIVLNTEKTVDITSADGKNLKDTYNITKVPLLILSPDTKYYTSLVQAWKNVGTVESDGWFIMRKPEILGTYKDLTTNQVIEQQK